MLDAWSIQFNTKGFQINGAKSEYGVHKRCKTSVRDQMHVISLGIEVCMYINCDVLCHIGQQLGLHPYHYGNSPKKAVFTPITPNSTTPDALSLLNQQEQVEGIFQAAIP